MANSQLVLPPFYRPLLAAVGSVIIMILLTLGVTTEEIMDLDRHLLQEISVLRNPLADSVFSIGTWLGSFYLLGTFVLVVILILGWKRQNALAGFLGLAFYGASGVTLVLKMFMVRERPLIREDIVLSCLGPYSFPSGHATHVAAFVLAVFWLTGYQRSNVKIMFIICSSSIVALVALSRVYFFVHWPSDVLGGIFVAMFWVNAILAVYSFLNTKKRADA